jgi:5'/3'-nucleotidase SurE
MLILLTNDDGIYAPGLAALEKELRQIGEVYVVSMTATAAAVGRSKAARPTASRSASSSSARVGPIWSSAALTAG